MSVDCSRLFNLVGLALSLVGVLILFRWGMPFHVPTQGANYLVTGQVDAKEVALERRYKIIGYVGLVLLILGTVLQMGAVLMPDKGNYPREARSFAIPSSSSRTALLD